MRHTETFQFAAPITKAQQDDKGDWVFEACASLPGKDLQEEEVDPRGLETDYLFGKGLPHGAGGFVNYDHESSTIVGIPLDGRINSQGLFMKWKGLKTPFMEKIVDQMRAMEKAGGLRRYGMSIEGVVKERDPDDPRKIKRAYIRNVALTPTPVHPGTWVEFAKSLAAGAALEYHPDFGMAGAIRQWAGTVADIRKGLVTVRASPYFRADGTFRTDADPRYFRDVAGLTESQALWCARFALSRQDALCKALTANGMGANLVPQSLDDPYHAALHHLQRWKDGHPDDPHISPMGNIIGGDRAVAEHFLRCEHRPRREVVAIVRLLHGSSVLDPDNAL